LKRLSAFAFFLTFSLFFIHCSRPILKEVPSPIPALQVPPAPPAQETTAVTHEFTPAPAVHAASFRVPRNTVRVFLASIPPFCPMAFSGAYTVYGANNARGTLEGKTTLALRGREAAFSTLPGRFALPVTLRPALRGSTFKFGSGTYLGGVIIRLSASGGPILINELPIEDYLKGVVPYEIGKRDSACFEALKVQAIVARTYTYSRLGSQDTSGFDLYPDQSDQVYSGIAEEYPLANAAVDSTRDVVITSKDSLIQAFYYSTSNGRTANIEEVWPERGFRAYLRSVNDSIYNTGSKYFTWTETWDGPSLEKIINKSLVEMNGDYSGKGHLQDLEVEAFTSCGRVKSLAVTLSGRTYRICGDKVRWLLRRNGVDRPILRSASFTLQVDKGAYGLQNVRALGRGFGHGVGLSQMGAIGMALAGKKADEIIQFYYTGVALAIASY
jgi:stage II sporulation protein D